MHIPLMRSSGDSRPQISRLPCSAPSQAHPITPPRRPCFVLRLPPCSFPTPATDVMVVVRRAQLPRGPPRLPPRRSGGGHRQFPGAMGRGGRAGGAIGGGERGQKGRGEMGGAGRRAAAPGGTRRRGAARGTAGRHRGAHGRRWGVRSSHE
jgi:hypothetical protein